MPITPVLDNSTLFLACLGNGDDPLRWLNGDTGNGGVNLTYRLPSVGVDVSGTLWKAVPSTCNAGSYALRALGSNTNPNYQYLDGTPGGSVVLDSDPTAQSASWQLLAVPNPADFYPHQPWGSAAAQSYTFQVKNVHTATYLNGNTGDGSVGLTSDTTQTGTNWLVLVAAWA
ncbi:MAG: hypothetical protein ABUT39_04530 [Acidobacteriota bacterium]